MLDAKLLDFNYDFLKEIESKLRMISTDIKMIAINRLNPGQYTVRYADVPSIKSQNNSIFQVNGDPKDCQVGDCVQIENVLITNQNFSFPNQFHIRNITGTMQIVEKVRFDRVRDKFYIEEIQRFKQLLISVFTNYIRDFNELKAIIDACYVDACYVDKYYNCPDIDIESPDAIIPFDISIEAGPYRFYAPRSSNNIVTVGLTGATATPGYDKLIWEATSYTGGSTFSVTDLLTFATGSTSIIGPTITTLTDGVFILTLSAVYPWGVTTIDSRTYERLAPRIGKRILFP